MRASIYARYSSDNQRQESIEDQIASCTRYAVQHAFDVLPEHVYSDRARSGASHEREGLTALLAAARAQLIDVVLVDDLSRLARDNTFMLNALADLRYWDVRLVSVADRLDTADDDATLGIQLRGIFNELSLKDLGKKTFRGQLGQKERGSYVGERTYGYRSEPMGEVHIDKRGRPRPGRLRHAHRAGRGGHRPADLQRVRCRCSDPADRHPAQRGGCTASKARRLWLGALYRLPYPQPRKICWPLGLEPYRQPP